MHITEAIIMGEILLWLAVLAAVWAVLGIGLARENERVVKILLGRPYAVVESGLFWIPFGFAWVRRYTTKVVELTFAQRGEDGKISRNAQGRVVSAGGFITAPGKVQIARDTRKVGPVNIGVTLSLRFNWPQDEQKLIQCVKLLPSPQRIDQLTDIFQEIIMDETRSVGCKMTYIDIMSDRSGFAMKIAASVTQGQASQLLIDTGLQSSARVVIDHIDIPQDALDAIDDEEAKRLQAEGVRRQAEGKKDQLRLESEGLAEGYKAIKEAGPEAIQLESLRTLREMAQGTANTIFFPLEAIQKLFGNFLQK